MKRKRVYSFILLISISLAFAACARDVEPETAQTPVNNELVNKNLSQAAALFAAREDTAKLRQAVKLLDAARNPAARNFEVEWKFSQYSYFLGKQIDADKESDRTFADGAKAGQIASRIAPDKADGYFWYAANLGEQARKSPLTVGVSSVDDIRAAMNKVIEIEPAYEGASAFDALGLIELETRMIGGKPEKAIEYLEKGLTYDPNNSFLHLHLAQAYLAVDRDQDAKKHLQTILNLKPDPEYVVEYRENLEAAKKLLAAKF